MALIPFRVIPQRIEEWNRWIRSQTKILGTEGGTITGDLKIEGDKVDFTSLPTADPGVAGRLWSDQGTVKVSAG